MRYEELLSELKDLELSEVINLYVEAKTEKPLSIEDVFDEDVVTGIYDLEKIFQALLP